MEDKLLVYAGDIYYVHEDFMSAINYYDTASEINPSVENIINEGILYYKIGIKYREMSYLKKAEKILSDISSKTDEWKAKYYLGLTLLSLGKTMEGINNMKDINEEEISDQTISSVIDSYVFLSNMAMDEQMDALSDINDPFLLNFFNFISDFAKDRYTTQELAERLKILYKKIILNKKWKEKLPNHLDRYLLLIYAIMKKTDDFEEAYKWIVNKDIRKFPLSIRMVINEFSKYMGIKEFDELPYFIKKEIEKLDWLVYELNLINQMKSVKDIQPIINEEKDEEIKRLLNDLKSQPVSRMNIINELIKKIKNEIKYIETMAIAFYNKSKAKYIVESIISTLNIDDSIKMELL